MKFFKKGIADKMKSVGLVQIFCPVKETNRTHSRSYVEDLSTQTGRKRCTKTAVLNLSVLPKVSVLAVAVLVALSSYAAAAASLTGLRSSSTTARDRIVFDLSEMPLYQARPSDDGRSLTLDFADVDTALFKRIAVRTSRIEAISYERHHGHFYVTVALAKGMDYSIGNLTNPFRIFVDVAPKGALTAQRHASVPRPSVPSTDTDAPAKAELPRMEEKQLAAGLTQREYVYADEDGQVTAYFIEADPARYRVRPALARGVIPGRQTVSGIAQDTNAAAAINASYFALSGELIGITKIDGTVVSSTYFNRSAFGVMPDNSFVFGTVSYNGTVKLDQASLPISGVNAERGEDNLIIYNRAYGRSTGTNPYGLEYVVRNGRVAEINTNDSLIPSDGYVVSVHGTSMDAFAAAGVRVGDPAVLTEDLGEPWNRAVQVLGAGPRLVENGSVHVTAGEEQFPGDIRYGRAPRTAVGVTQKGNILFAVVDGRQSHSHGLTLTEFADLLVQFGVRDAINLDGGGSSEIYADGDVLNSPSDGSERAVGSALILQKK